MSRRALLSSDQVRPVAFAETLGDVAPEHVAAYAPGSRRPTSGHHEALERLREMAQKEGYEAGFQKGLTDGEQLALAQGEAATQARLAEITAELEARGEQLVFAMQQWMESAEAHLAELAVAIAGQILHQEIALPHDTITAMTREAIAAVNHADRLRIRVNPFDAPCLAEHRQELLNAARHVKHIEIVDDPEIFGGCVIESDGGAIDAVIATQLGCTLRAVREAA